MDVLVANRVTVVRVRRKFHPAQLYDDILRLAEALHEDRFGLDVAMHEALRVHLNRCREHLLDDHGDLSL